ncbi:hypothetical protein [Epilithonimonas vandammei]|uniref:hypothetical protein n=1 Tax=Epilithonimonas vandammei TaxID=2487072 RepID=UPI0028A6758D|nr:hypothetical protein [Epilithonimonas vandammei]
MQNNKKITNLKNNLPLGGMIEIAKRTGLTSRTIDNIFKGKKCRMNNKMKVITEAEKIISEYKTVTEG